MLNILASCMALTALAMLMGVNSSVFMVYYFYFFVSYSRICIHIIAIKSCF